MQSSGWGSALVGLAAILWATDALFRYPAVNSLDPTWIVLCEHIICVLGILPWVLATKRKTLTALKPTEWVGCILVGAGGSALAAVFFTASFRFINPSVAILLQKLQPVIVILLALLFLGEKPSGKFLLWSPVAILAGLVLSFPDLKFDFVSKGIDFQSKGVIYALGAASIWAVSTVIGKALLKNTAPSVITFWRFFFGLFGLLILAAMGGVSMNTLVFQDTKLRESILYMGLLPGLVAVAAYYQGLKRTPASVATVVELLFPVSAVILNTFYLHTPLNGVQMLAGMVLIFAVTMISLHPPTTKSGGVKA